MGIHLGGTREDVRDRSEHALVDTEQKIWDLRASDRRCGKNVPQANILQVTNEFSGGVRECEGVAPEEPLE